MLRVFAKYYGGVEVYVDEVTVIGEPADAEYQHHQYKHLHNL